MSKEKQEQQEKETKELQQKPEETSLATDNFNSDFSGNEEADSTDIIVPRILLMQGTSKWVPETFNMGEIIDSVEEKVLAPKGETLTILPFIMTKTWEVFSDEQPPKWLRKEKWNAANDQLDWKFTDEDPDRGTVECFRQRNYGFYCFVLEKDGSIDEFAVPSLINFRSASGFKEGKKIASWFARMKSMNKPGFTVTWKIKSETVKEEDKSFQKFVVTRGENSTEEQQKVVMKWLDLFAKQQGNIKDHVVDETDAESPRAPMSSGEVGQQAQF